MPPRKRQTIQAPLPPIEDELLKALEQQVMDVLKSEDAKPREKATMVAHGIRLAYIKHRINGPREGESFFG